VVNIALDDYDTLIESIKSVLYAAQQKIQVHKNQRIFSFDIYRGEIDHLEKMVGQVELDLMSFQKLLFKETLVRNSGVAVACDKRGLLNL
jgi:hypothetical protein